MTTTSIAYERDAPQLSLSPQVVAGFESGAATARQASVEESATAHQAGGAEGVRADEIEVALYHDLAAVEQVWRAFEGSADHTFFQSFAWLDAWQRHVGARARTIPVVVTGTHLDGTLLFILPLAVQKRRGLRLLTFLGSELCDYNAPLLAENLATLADGEFPALWRRILDALHANPRFGFDLVNLEKMPERVGRQPNPFMALRRNSNPSGAYVTALGGVWDEFYKLKRSAGTRKKERSQLRQLGEFGAVRFVDELDGEERARTLDTLFAQKASSFARMGVRNIFTRPGHRELFTAMVMDPRYRHLVHLSRLEIGDMIAAASVGLTERGCYYLVVSSYDGGGDMARLGPGRAHLNELLGYAIKRGFDTFDFTIGDELYKQDWSDARLTLYDHISAATPLGAIAVAVVTRFRATKRAIKQNPHFWRLFSRARSHLGSLRSGPPRGTETTATARNTPASSQED